MPTAARPRPSGPRRSFASLIHDTLTWLPENSSRRAAWIHHLGMLAQARGDYDEAARQYQRALDISERLGGQAGTATCYSQFGSLVAEGGGPVADIVAWHIRALAIRLRIGVPQAVNNLRQLLPCRHELGAESFAALLAQITDDVELIEAIPRSARSGRGRGRYNLTRCPT